MSELALYNPNSDVVSSICTFSAKTPAEMAKFYNIVSNPEKRLQDIVNMTIDVCDSYAEIVEVKNELTGEMENAPRVILIDKDGHSYVSVSKGIYNAITRLYGLFGMKHWDVPIPLKVGQVTKGSNRILTLTIDEKFYK